MRKCNFNFTCRRRKQKRNEQKLPSIEDRKSKEWTKNVYTYKIKINAHKIERLNEYEREWNTHARSHSQNKKWQSNNLTKTNTI